MELTRAECDYTPFYCEENAWRLLQRPELAALDPAALFISNPDRACVFLGQRLQVTPDEPMLWDYHVVVLTRGPEGPQIWDLDGTLPFPCPAAEWLDATFALTPHIPPTYHPRFRLVPAPDLLQTFASDRSHMRDGDAWTQPPPAWPPIQSGPAPTMNLMDFVDTLRPWIGRLFTLSTLRQTLRSAP